MDLKQAIKSKCAKVEGEMRKYAMTGDKRINQMMLHPINAGGKRVRPFLTIVACEAVGGKGRHALPAAASVELLHTFTLVHDDIMDKDLERRGKPTVHSLWGDDLAILVGDALYSASFKAMAGLHDKGVEPKVVLEALMDLMLANEEVNVGQMMDMLFEGAESVSERDYLSMIQKKTGALIEASVVIGATVGGAKKRQLDALRVYGMNCGLAFQIKDDVLDLTADRRDFGKPIGSDIRSGKKTLIVIHAMKNAPEMDRKALLGVLGRDDASDAEVDKVIRALAASGSIAYCEKRVTKLVSEAKKSLDVLEDSESKRLLLALADYFVERRV